MIKLTAKQVKKIKAAQQAIEEVYLEAQEKYFPIGTNIHKRLLPKKCFRIVGHAPSSTIAYDKTRGVWPVSKTPYSVGSLYLRKLDKIGRMYGKPFLVQTYNFWSYYVPMEKE